MNDPFSSASTLLAAQSQGNLSAEELMAQTLERIAHVNPQVNAIVDLADSNSLLEAARTADRVPAEDRGLLHGLPLAIKDLANVKGFRNTEGSLIHADRVVDQDELMVARLRKEGAIFIGKTNVPEFGLGSHTFNPVHGATLNPYSNEHTCGGSSGGAAVALATGMLALADGSDMMGSLRNPAAWNNVYGFRPSIGRVPKEPAGDQYLHQLSTLGPMARSPSDIALMLEVMSGPDPRHPFGLADERFTPLKRMDLSHMRVGWISDWGGAYEVEKGLLEVSESTCAVLAELGAVVDPLVPDFPMERIWESWIALRSFSVAMGLRGLQVDRNLMKDSALWELDRGLSMSALDVQEASEARSEWFRAAIELFQRYDLLVMPTTQVWPFPVEQPYPISINGCSMDTYHRWMEVVVPVSLLGLPSLAVPSGFGAGGLPTGVQLIGAPGTDRFVLEVGEAYHHATHWPQRMPPPDCV